MLTSYILRSSHCIKIFHRYNLLNTTSQNTLFTTMNCNITAELITLEILNIISSHFTWMELPYVRAFGIFRNKIPWLVSRTVPPFIKFCHRETVR